MAGTIFSGSYTSGISLSSATQNPATIASTGVVSNLGTTNGSHAIYGEVGTAWTVFNYGAVNGLSTATAAVYLASGGSLTNGSSAASSAEIFGTKTALTMNRAAGTVSNFGTLFSNATGTVGASVYLDGGGLVTNQARGLILGSHTGVSSLAAGTINNSGTIQSSSTSTGGVGIYLAAGGKVSNQSGGLVLAYDTAINTQSAAATVNNYGSIENSGKASAIDLGDGGAVTNASAGYISSGKQSAVLVQRAAGALVNNGKIASGGSGATVYFGATGNVTNTGTIALAGAGAALDLKTGGTVVNSGTLYAPSGVGFVVGSATAATTGTASATNNGLIYGLVGVAVSSPTTASPPIATIVNYGTITGSNGVAVSFDDSGSTLVIEHGSVLNGTLAGFAPGGTIDFAHVSGTAATFSYGVLSLMNGGTAVGTIALSGAFDSADFSVSSDGVGGTDVKVSASAAALPNDLTGNGVSDVLMFDTNTDALVVGEMSAGSLAYTPIGGIGPEWQFGGMGPLLGDGRDGFLLWAGNPSDPDFGALVVGEDVGGTAKYTQIGAFGTGWKMEGVGPLEGGANADFLLWNQNSDAVVVGAVNDLSAQYTQIGGVGPEWQFEGVGNYVGNGSSEFLMWDTSASSASDGALVLGQDVDGTAQYTAVGALSPTTWVFEGSGNLLDAAGGADSFLIWNQSTGALDVGAISNGAAQYTQVGGVGPEWQFLGVGNYDGASPAEFLMRDSNNGALVLGTIVSGHASYVQVGGVGPEWNFHNASPALVN